MGGVGIVDLSPGVVVTGPGSGRIGLPAIGMQKLTDQGQLGIKRTKINFVQETAR